MDTQKEAVRRMQEYIDKNLDRTITPADLARAAGYSPWHAARLFCRCLGQTPADYIRRLRLSRAALRLRDERVRVLDAALDAGFESEDGFQRAFFREFGCNPGQWARSPVPIWLFTPYLVEEPQKGRGKSMENVQTVFVQRVEKPPRKVIIKRGRKARDYFSYCEEVGCEVWGLLRSIRSLDGEPVCLWLPERLVPPGTSVYVQGAQVAADYDGPVPQGFDLIELPAASYLLFRGEPFDEADYCDSIEALRAAAEKYDPAFLGLAWDHENPRIQLEPIGARGYIELLPVRELD